MNTLRLVLFAFCCGAAIAQTPPKPERVPVHGAGSLEALRQMHALVYRPREHGLDAVRFKVRSEVERDEKTSTFGPWIVTWRKKKHPVVTDVDGKPVELDRSFVVRLIRDVIGDRGARDVEGNHLRLDGEGHIEVRVPDWVRGGAARRSQLVRDDEGRLAEQRFYGLGNELATSVRYTWTAHGKSWCVASRVTGVDDKVHVTRYTRSEVAGFLLPTRIVAEARGVATETIFYSDYVVNPPAPQDPKPAEDGDSGR